MTNLLHLRGCIHVIYIVRGGGYYSTCPLFARTWALGSGYLQWSDLEQIMAFLPSQMYLSPFTPPLLTNEQS